MPRPRTARGGRRQGAQGKAYTNRSDLNQAPRAVPGQTYGVAGAQLASQQVAPLPNRNQTAAPMMGGGGGAPMPMPGPLDAPTERPGEPLTTGLATGPGGGPETLIGAPGAPNPIDEIRAMYAAYPSDDLRRLLAFLGQ